MPVVTFPYPEPSAVLLAGDWHGSPRAARTAIAEAADYGADVVIQLGDFGFGMDDTAAGFLAGVSREARAAGIPVLWIDGNHEDSDQLYEHPVDPDSGLRPVAPSVRHLPRGSRWEWAGIRFTAMGGATSFDRLWRVPGRSWWPDEAITCEQAEMVCSEGETDFLLSHDCPAGVTIPGITPESSRQFWPESELQTAWAHARQLADIVTVLRPTHIFHGHYHLNYTANAELAPGPETLVIGLGDDGTGNENRMLVSLADLAADVQARRGE